MTAPAEVAPRWRRHLPQLAVLLLVLVVVLVARAALVGGGDDGGPGFLADLPLEQEEDPAEPGDDGDDATSTTGATDATGGEGGGDDGEELPARLRDAALRASDLPGEWTEAAESTPIRPCPDRDPTREVAPEASDQVAFSGGATGPYVASAVARFGSEDRAEDFLDAAADAIDGCERFEEGGRAFRLERFSVSGLGDGSVAARIRGSDDDGTSEGPIYYVRVGSSVVTLAAVSLDGTSPDDLARSAVEAVVDRL